MASPCHLCRNITDLDDKINKRAFERGVTIRDLTEGTAARFHAAIDALGALRPTVEPRATEHIEEMKALCEKLVAPATPMSPRTTCCSPCPPCPAMAAVEAAAGRHDRRRAGGCCPYKRSEMTSCCGSPRARAHEPGWASPCGIAQPGRPGWHIECSAMSWKHLARCSTSMAAASTSSSPTTRTRWRRRPAPSATR